MPLTTLPETGAVRSLAPTGRALRYASGCVVGVLALSLLVVVEWQPLERLDLHLITSAVDWTERRPELYGQLSTLGVVTGKRILWSVAAVLALVLWLARRRYGAMLLAGSIAATTVVTGGLKRVLERERPEWYLPEDPLPTSSFPSGHVSLWVAFVGVPILLLLVHRGSRGRLPAGLLVAALGSAPLLISVQRVLVGRHYPSDVVAGVLVGAGCVLVTWVVLAELSRAGWPSGSRRRFHP